LHLPLKAPEAGILKLHVKDPAARVAMNGHPLHGERASLESGQVAVLSIASEKSPPVGIQWIEAESIIRKTDK
jgi:hypothetical protein